MEGKKKKKALLTRSVIYTARWSLKTSGKVGQSAHSDPVYFGKVCEGSKASIRSQPHWKLWVFPGLEFHLLLRLPTRGRLWPRRSSQLISSLSESHTTLTLCLWWSLMLIHCCPPNPYISWNCQWAALKSWKWAKSTFSEVRCLMSKQSDRRQSGFNNSLRSTRVSDFIEKWWINKSIIKARMIRYSKRVHTWLVPYLHNI